MPALSLTPVPSGPPETAHLRRLAWLFDDAVRLPFGLRAGLDALLGLIPVAGDVATAVIATIGLATAVRLGAPAPVLFRMLYNIGVDAAVGAIPILGDLFDVVWVAQHRNVALLEAWLARPDHVARRSRWLLVGVLASAILVVTAAAALGLWLFVWLLRLAGR